VFVVFHSVILQSFAVRVNCFLGGETESFEVYGNTIDDVGLPRGTVVKQHITELSLISQVPKECDSVSDTNIYGHSQKG